MKILCFGAFAEVLRICCRGFVKGNVRNRNETVPQKILIGELLNAIDTGDFKDWSNGDNAAQLARKLLRCEQHIPDELKPAADAVSASIIAIHFREKVIPLLDKPEVVVLAIRDIIENDTGMQDGIIASYYGVESKQGLLSVSQINLADFLSNTFIYVIRGIDNKNGKVGIAEINEDYVLAFEMRTNEIKLDTSALVASSKGITSLKAQRSLFEIEASNEFTPPIGEWNLVLEVGGECPDCGKLLSEEKNGRSVPRYMITVIDSSQPTLIAANRIALCPECHDRYLLDTTAEEVSNMTQIKTGFVNLVRSRNALSENKVPVEIQIEEVLTVIEMTPESNLKRICDERVYEVEQKVTENIVLMRKIRENALDYFECVETLLKASDRARSQKFRLFQSKVIACYEEAKANETSQEKIYNHLVEWLFRQAKYQHRGACEIIIAFFVQICDVFEIEVEDDEYALAQQNNNI